MGYDPQLALLEVRLANDGKVRQYRNVPEETWYHLRDSYYPEVYYRRYICGCYAELILSEESA
ncbi:MAG: KTSC domain-containing protein [Lachnospiraceae bacterium]|nr:KTSC domain-containing protein [Lachnospiraceae bacterium]